MEKLKLWLSAFRLRTLPLSLSGVMVASFLAYYNGFFNGFICLLAICATLSFQILSNLANDYGDGVKGTDSNERIGPERALQSGKITPDEMMHAIRLNILISIFLVVILIYVSFRGHNMLYSLLFFLLGGMTIYAAMKYTIGKSAYGYKALGDVMVFLFFGVLSVLGTYFLYAKQMDHVTILPACVIGLLSTGVLNLNNMRDIKSDKASSKITVAVKLGLERAKQYHIVLISTAIVLAILFGILYYTSVFNLIYFIGFVPLILHLKRVVKITEPQLLDNQLKVLALSTFALSLLMGIGHIYNAI